MTLQTKKRGNVDYLYDYTKDSGKIKSTYLGKVGDPKTEAKVKEFAEAQDKKKNEKKAKKKPFKTIAPLDSIANTLEKNVGPVPLPKPEPKTFGEAAASKTSGYQSPEERQKPSKTGLFL